MSDPVLIRALEHLKTDKRVVDFCGEDIKPGWMINRESKPGENWKKFGLSVSGASGSLRATVIGDYLIHKEL